MFYFTQVAIHEISIIATHEKKRTFHKYVQLSFRFVASALLSVSIVVLVSVWFCGISLGIGQNSGIVTSETLPNKNLINISSAFHSHHNWSYL